MLLRILLAFVVSALVFGPAITILFIVLVTCAALFVLTVTVFKAALTGARSASTPRRRTEAQRIEPRLGDI